MSINSCVSGVSEIQKTPNSLRAGKRLRTFRGGTRPFYFGFAILSTPLVFGTLLLFRAKNLSVNWQFLWPILRLCGSFLGIGICSHIAAACEFQERVRWKWKRLRSGCFLAIYSFLLVAVLQLTPYGLARSSFPFQDPILTRLDSLLGISVPHIVSWCHAHSFWWEWSVRVYSTLIPFVFVAIAVPALSGTVRVSQRLLLGTLSASMLAFAIFAFFPAIGPWAGNRFIPAWSQDFYVHELTALRGPGAFQANPAHTSGQITFPSFHVILAILSAIAFWPFRWLRLPAIILATGICISTVTVGWHYGVDGIAGAVLALAGDSAAEWILPLAPDDLPAQNVA